MVQATKVTKAEFSVTLHDGWEEISREVLDLAETQKLEIPIAKKYRHFDYGFSLSSPTGEFTGTYVTFRIENTGRIFFDASLFANAHVKYMGFFLLIFITLRMSG